MKNSSVLAFLAAGAVLSVFADNEQKNTSWFTGIGQNATSISNLDSTGGTWGTLSEEEAEVSGGKLVLDLDATSEAAFTVSAGSESGTAQQLAVTAVFTPCQPAELMSGSALAAKGAQVAFAVVNTAESTYKYYAWVGATGGATGFADWVELATLPVDANLENEASLTIDIAYWAAKATATFKIGGTQIGAVKDLATTLRAFDKVSCAGSGTIATVNGQYNYGVAKYTVDDVDYKFPTADAAIKAAAGFVGSKPEVVLTRDADGAVAVNPSVAVNNNGHTAALDPGESTDPVEVKLPTTSVASGSGEYVLDVSTSADASRFVITTTDSSKEVAVSKKDGKLVATVQTSATILNNVVPTDAKALTHDMAKYRAFLNTYAGASSSGKAYTKANTSVADIKAAIEETPSNKNGLKLWQDYVLGITPEISVKPVATTGSDNLSKAIKLSIPGIDTAKYSGDYTVKYKVGSTEVLDPQAIQVPLSTGMYDVKIVLE